MRIMSCFFVSAVALEPIGDVAMSEFFKSRALIGCRRLEPEEGKPFGLALSSRVAGCLPDGRRLPVESLLGPVFIILTLLAVTSKWF